MSTYSLTQIRSSPAIIASLKPLTITLKQKPPVFQKTLVPFNGGTGMTSFNDGDMFVGYQPVLSIIPIGNFGQVLSISNTGVLIWSDNLTLAKNNLVNYDLVNKYTFYETQANNLLLDFSAKGIQIFQVEQDAGFANTDIINASAKINANEAQLNNNDSIVAQLTATTNDAQNQMTQIYSNLAITETNISNLDSNLDLQLTDVQGLFTQVNDLNNDISNVYTNVTSDISFKNMIVNGDFQIWQRSTSYTGSNTHTYLTADRWYHSNDHNGTLTSQKSSSIVNSLYANTLLLSLSGANNGLSLMTTVENAMSLQNTYATLSFYVRCNTVQALTVTIVQNFGLGGSTAITLGIDTCTTSTSWTRWSTTVNVPDISGYYVGPNSYFQIIIKTATSFTNLELAYVQFEENISATNITSRPYALEELLCKRYYEEGYTTFSGRATANLGVSVTHSYSVTKYKTPNISSTVVSSIGFTSNATVGFMNDLNNGSTKVTKDNTSGFGSFTAKFQAESEII